MAFEFKLPDIGEGVVEGEVVKWKVAEGEPIGLDQPMVEVMTDKATVEIPSPRAGKVARILVAEGKTCAVGQSMIVIDDGASAPVAAAVAVPAPAPASASAPATVAVSASAPAPAPAGRAVATPSTRRLARELGVDLAHVPATGRAGRITSDDVRGVTSRPASPTVAPSVASGGGEERVPFRGLRKAIAQNMSRSISTATHFTYVDEVDVTDLVALRARTKERAAERGVKLSYLPFVVKAIVQGLQKWPSINASLDEERQEIVRKKYYHLGIAIQGPQGLSVGVIRDAGTRSIVELGAEIERLSAAIRSGKATRDDLTGSTFTVSSLGQLGGLLATPIINFPEAAILGVHKIVERPAVRAGQIVVRSLMNLSISVDHRIADGYDAAMFVQEVKTYLEDPTLLFLEMI